MQQINLYTEDFRPKRVLLSLEQILLLPVVSILILVLLTFWMKSDLNLTMQELSAQQDKKDNLQLKLGKLEGKAKLQIRDESLVAANLRLSETLLARERMIGMLDTVVVKDDEGFSNILISLARQKIDGLWLNAIKIGSSGKEMTLKGVTIKASSVPEYLQKLRREPSFIGRSFTLFELDQTTDQSHQIDFILRSELNLNSNDGQSVKSILSSNIDEMER